MTVKEMQEKILQLKKENDICILAHSYVAREIIEVADFTGDSFQLSVEASKTDAPIVIMCGVRFMAETVKILSPEKKVFITSAVAGCPMAEQMSKEYIEGIKKENPDHTVVAYINTTAELKTVCDVCVTSASAVNVVKKLESDKILFIPDCNLGDFVAKQVPEKTFMFVNGGCPIHGQITADDVKKARKYYPDSLLLVHPECKPEVVSEADYVGSTTGIMKYAKESEHKNFIIGTEISIAESLQYECPEKNFYALSPKLICPDMKATTLVDLYNTIIGNGGEEITLDEDTINKAKKCIDKMLELG